MNHKSEYMRRFLALLLFILFASCSKNYNGPSGTVEIPVAIEGVVTDFNLTPLDSITPGKGIFLISANNTVYKVEFNAVAQAQSNATLEFGTDTILIDESREFTNLGKDAISYNPVKENEILLLFSDGRKVTGSFDINTNFGGVFGESLISRWRDSAIPSKPNQKAKDDIIHLVQRYGDKDGTGPETAPQYLSVKVSKN
jgi:hypothetical protein